jgi:hypothetical protein
MVKSGVKEEAEMKKRYLIPILVAVFMIGYGVRAVTQEAKTVELAGRNVELMWENRELREAVWDAQDIIIDLRTSLMLLKDTETSSLSYDDKCRLMEIENEMGKLETRLWELEMERQSQRQLEKMEEMWDR